MRTEQIQKALVKEISDILGVPITSQEDFSTLPEIDSFVLLQIVAFIEDEYDLVIPEEFLHPEHFTTVHAIASWLIPLKGHA